jgi:hypothetical protein
MFAVVGPSRVATLSAIQFQGWFIRQVNCYTLLSGFRLPLPLSCCLDETTSFMMFDGREFRQPGQGLAFSKVLCCITGRWVIVKCSRAFACPNQREDPRLCVAYFDGDEHD